jgi:hypothetical protein
MTTRTPAPLTRSRCSAEATHKTSSSTSPRSARSAWWARVLGPLLAGCACAPAGPRLVATPASTAPQPSHDIDSLRALLAEAVRAVRQYPASTSARVELPCGGPRDVRMGQEDLIVVAVRAVFFDDDQDRGDCQLAVVRGTPPHAEIVPLPGGGYEACFAMRKVAEADVNGDGIPDFLYEFDVPSNRYDATVTELVLYVSQPAKRTYCFAKKASVYAARPGMDEQGALQALRVQTARLGAAVVGCEADTRPE